jgi:pyruvate dehydrogenase E2 component (dihydrolipoamide acetyltransferase)
MEKVLMPKLGMAQKWCVVEKWHKKEGDEINLGDLLVEVSTDKINYEVESKNSGVVLKVLRKEKEEVPVGETIAYIGKENEKVPENNNGKEEESLVSNNLNKIKNDKKIKISAVAKKIAEKNNIEISDIKGSGPRGRITKNDVMEYLKNSEISTEKESPDSLKTLKSNIRIYHETPLVGMRKIIAEKMVFSKQNIPHIAHSTKADVTKLVELKDKIKPFYNKLTFTDFIIKMASNALRENLALNSSLLENKHIIYKDINIGLVVAVPNGIIVPTFPECDKLTIFDIANKRRDLVGKVRENKISMDEISNGTSTISNLGIYNIRNFTAIIYPPQGAILSVGTIYTSPEVMSNGEIKARKVLEISITLDHRILDGADGAKFLTRLAELLENPELLMQEIKK